MTQQEFYELSKRYLEGKTTETEEELLSQWLEKQPVALKTDLNLNEQAQMQERLWRQLRPPRLLTGTRWFGWAAAACAVGLLGFFCQQWLATPTPPIVIRTVGQKGIEIANTANTDHEITLADGTLVRLKQNSRLVYDKTFNQSQRVVYLKGEAFFKVKRDESKPFVVHTGDLVTEVLGTSFWIKPNANNAAIEVSVVSGKVSVYTNKKNQNDERNGVILTPNQRVLFDVASKSIAPSLVENPLPVQVAQPQQLVFADTPLKTVLRQLTDLYGIEFITSAALAHCQFTADLNGLSLYVQLELVCKSLGASYERRGTVVFINGDGCQEQ
ncbi:MAG: FecR family protein [Runella slithyformis]|nr:MAG: FecR family protein [Runella slithyformis]